MKKMSETTGAVSSKSSRTNTAESFTPSPEVLKSWNEVYKAFRGEFGEAVFRSWLKPLTLQAYYHGTLEVSVPTRFMRDWIQTHYSKRILEMSMQKHEDIKRLEIVVVQSAMALNGEMAETSKPLKANQNKAEQLSDPFELSSPLDPRFT